jgi:CRP-like cAMP-binding protein
MAIDSTLYTYVVNELIYQDKAVIIEENSTGDWVYVVLEGKAQVRKNTPKGQVTLAILREGSIFGEMALFNKVKKLRTASVVADGPLKLGLLDKVRLDKEFESLSPALKSLIKTMISRLADTTTQASLLAKK